MSLWCRRLGQGKKLGVSSSRYSRIEIKIVPDVYNRLINIQGHQVLSPAKRTAPEAGSTITLAVNVSRQTTQSGSSP